MQPHAGHTTYVDGEEKSQTPIPIPNHRKDGAKTS